MKYVIIGASAAGLTAAKTVRQLAADVEITVISTDTIVHSRVMLHQFLSGARAATGLSFVPENFFESNGICWLKGEKVTSVNSAENSVMLESGAQVPYDRLLIASGARYVVPPLPHFREANNVFGLRTLSDAQLIIEAVQASKASRSGGGRCVVVGSGLVGLDAAFALCERGVSCSLVEMADRLSPLQLDTAAASSYQKRFEAHGCSFYLAEKATDSAIDSRGNIVSVSLAGGVTLPCDFVVVAAGVRPNFGFLEGSGIETDHAVTVDACLRTNIENVWAAGDVAGITGIWPNAMRQGEVAARNMCGHEMPYADKYGTKNSMNYYGLTTVTMGVNAYSPGDTVIVREGESIYGRAILRDGVVIHVILQGDISGAGIWQELMEKKSFVSLDTLAKLDPKYKLDEWKQA